MPEVQVEEAVGGVDSVDIDQLIADFEHQDLSTYDPDFKAFDQDTYELRLVGSPRERKGTGKNGKPYVRKSMSVAVVGGPNAGRRVFVDEFLGKFTQFAKKIMDVTGISQDNGETISDYLTKVGGIENTTFRALVTKEHDSFRDKDVNRLMISSISAV